MFCGTRRSKKTKEIDVDEVNCLGIFRDIQGQKSSKAAPKDRRIVKSDKSGKAHEKEAPPKEVINRGCSVHNPTSHPILQGQQENRCAIHNPPSQPFQEHYQEAFPHPHQITTKAQIHHYPGKENMEPIYESDLDFDRYHAAPRTALAPIPENVYGYISELPGNRLNEQLNKCGAKDCGAPDCIMKENMYQPLYQPMHQRATCASAVDISKMEPMVDPYRGKTIPLYQLYKGQLKVSIYMNCGLLTVHIMQGRQLTSQMKEFCNSYIVVSLIPEDENGVSCRTDVIPDSNNPVYDEKFSFELLPEDYQKRILISMWNEEDSSTGEAEFLGCMSFGVSSLQARSKQVNGWYILLSEEIGQKKHLQAPDRRQPLQTRGVGGSQNIPAVSQDCVWMDSHTVLIKRKEDGYGFTLGGWNPVKVARVEDGSAALRAGLCEGDCIIRVNGVNVSRSSADSIARIIRTSAKYVVMDVQRERFVDGPLSSHGSSSGRLSRQGSFRASDDQLMPPPRSGVHPSTALQDVGNKYGTLPRNRGKAKATFF